MCMKKVKAHMRKGKMVKGYSAKSKKKKFKWEWEGKPSDLRKRNDVILKKAVRNGKSINV